MGLFYCFGSLDINMFALVLFSRPLYFLYGQILSGKGSSGAVDFCSFSPGPLNFPIIHCLSTQKELFCRKLHITHGKYYKCHHLTQLEQGAGADILKACDQVTRSPEIILQNDFLRKRKVSSLHCSHFLAELNLLLHPNHDQPLVEF